MLPLIADYQRFYAGDAPSDEHNERFFAAFLEPSDNGLILVASVPGDPVPAGYACLYWTFSSVSATEVVLLNDLYVAPAHRGAGVAEARVAAAVSVGRERGAAFVRWMTALDNRQAQRLYERLGAERSSWF